MQYISSKWQTCLCHGFHYFYRHPNLQKVISGRYPDHHNKLTVTVETIEPVLSHGTLTLNIKVWTEH